MGELRAFVTTRIMTACTYVTTICPTAKICLLMALITMALGESLIVVLNEPLIRQGRH